MSLVRNFTTRRSARELRRFSSTVWQSRFSRRRFEHAVAWVCSGGWWGALREFADAGESSETLEGWQLISIPRRFRSLPEKFNALVGTGSEILVVWEDDDIYLPNHISSHVTAVEDHLWSKPSNVLSDYTSHIQEEDATGRFHASIALSRQGMVKCGGWPLTLRGDFDQQFIASLSGLGVHRDPCAIASPSYVFRWGSAAAYHGQALMRGPEDEAWYAAAELAALS